MVKDKILSKINSDLSYRKFHIENILNEMDFRIKEAPSYFKKGDVVKIRNGNKSRPAVVIKVVDDVLYTIPLSTKDNEYSLCPFTSRFYGTGWFTNSVVCLSVKLAKIGFYGVFDNTKDLNIAIKRIKNIVQKV